MKMNRLENYLDFAAGFVGLGYFTLWLFASDGYGSRLVGAALLPYSLPTSVHILGLTAALLVAVRVSNRALLGRSSDHTGTIALPGAPLPGATLRRARKKPRRGPRPVKPRDHFGLRGTPH